MKLKKWQIIVIIVVIVVLAGTLFGGDSDDTSQNNQQTDTTEVEKTYKMKDTVQVGDVEYVISKKTVTKTVGDQYVNNKAQDTYLIIDLSIKNLGKEQLNVTDSFFTLLNGYKEYKTDS